VIETQFHFVSQNRHSNFTTSLFGSSTAHDERGEPYYMRTATLVVVLGFSICAQGEPVELTAKNFDKKVFSTKSALVKFQAPW
jgi:hypothetical protein